MTGLHYITDEKGNRIGVQIDLREHGEFFEDFYDAWMIKQRKNDNDWISWEEAKRELRALDAREARARKKSAKAVKKPAKSRNK